MRIRQGRKTEILEDKNGKDVIYKKTKKKQETKKEIKKEKMKKYASRKIRNDGEKLSA